MPRLGGFQSARTCFSWLQLLSAIMMSAANELVIQLVIPIQLASHLADAFGDNSTVYHHRLCFTPHSQERQAAGPQSRPVCHDVCHLWDSIRHIGSSIVIKLVPVSKMKILWPHPQTLIVAVIDPKSQPCLP